MGKVIFGRGGKIPGTYLSVFPNMDVSTPGFPKSGHSVLIHDESRHGKVKPKKPVREIDRNIQTDPYDAAELEEFSVSDLRDLLTTWGVAYPKFGARIEMVKAFIREQRRRRGVDGSY